MCERLFRLGLIVNPLAGVGGPAGLKGSDGAATVAAALQAGAKPRAGARAARALVAIKDYRARIALFTGPGPMGAEAAIAAGFTPQVVGSVPQEDRTCAEDTRRIARALLGQGVDLLVFVGGDGTARDIYSAIGCGPPALGVPAGVKMHSGVYAVSPEAAGELIRLMLEADLVALVEQEVRDIDEEAFRAGVVKACYYGELAVPEAGGFLQQVKQGGREVEELVLADIAAEIIEQMQAGTLYIMGPGSTTRAVMEELGLDNTLLGVDVVQDGRLLAADVNGPQLEQILAGHDGEVKAVITAIGGQGHIIGRGNQQLTPAVLRRVGKANLVVIATKAKIRALQGRPLLVDSHDPQFDREMDGYIRVVTGYRDAILYPVGHAG
ncbi:ATP-NAD kinase [Exilibacterium tricleocarpae]|uniref:ATP-NAD kinase n=1 Tax=Exilibacterium tricleocarpae TaxID=2591008 RepID=A0A545SS49_9GAMM|nr:ATP-NAD kinase family protein [Exilibacterium tricleocarpae]TQV67800.1 ATP-NAD kinase [Exilibacterium tricleocarpae]